MPSARDCAERLREQAYKTLLPQIRGLQEELQSVSNSLSAGFRQIERKLEALRQVELPTTEVVLDEILGEMVRQKEMETGALALFARDLCRKETQEDILTLLLDGAQKYAPHLALFAVRGDRFVGWSSRGYSDALAGDIGSDSFPCAECPEFRDALEHAGPVAASNLPGRASLQSLQKEGQGPWQLFALRVLQRPVALLLAGRTEKTDCNPDALSVLVSLTALRLENIALRILYELAAGKPESAVQRISFTPSAAEPVEAPRVPEEIPAAQPVMTEEPAVETGAAPVPESISGAALAEEVSEAAAGIPAEAAETAPPPQPEISQAPKAEALPVLEEEKLHADAKRFARLLVSEIKLYNEHHVVEGRLNQDLYLRLKRDIDRSREMYEKRVSPTVSRKIDYFHDEIIRILGDNDPATLGSDYPGPRVES